MLIILKNTNSLRIENLLLAYSKDVIISVCYLKYVNKKGNCKNCGDDITDESDSNVVLFRTMSSRISTGTP
jgi:hypothetical protein